MKATTHKTITRLAIELCSNQLSKAMCKKRNSIINGSADEDNWYEINRAKNWHFYRSNDDIPKRVKKFKPTSEDILNKRINSVKNKNRRISKRYNSLGRVLHHIQDMSTPSHVLPIYHGPKFPLSLSFGIIDDHFETFMEENDCRITAKNIVTEISIEGVDGFLNIYNDAADDMLKNILKINENTDVADRPYSIYWKHYTEEEYAKIKGFGIYGESDEYFKKLPENNQQGITEKKLLNIQEIITTHAIINTCKALLYADNKGLDNV